MKFTAFYLLAIISSAHLSFGSSKPVDVPFESLITNPTRWSGSRVRVEGYICVDHNELVLYATKMAASNGVPDYMILQANPPPQLGRAKVTGIFEYVDTSHSLPIPGVIKKDQNKVFAFRKGFGSYNASMRIRVDSISRKR